MSKIVLTARTVLRVAHFSRGQNTYPGSFIAPRPHGNACCAHYFTSGFLVTISVKEAVRFTKITFRNRLLLDVILTALLSVSHLRHNLLHS